MIPTAERDAMARDYLQFAFSVARHAVPRHLHDEAESVALVALDQALRKWQDDGRFKLGNWVAVIVRRRVADWLMEETGWDRKRKRPRSAPPPVAFGPRVCDPETTAPDLGLDESDSFERWMVGLNAAERDLMRAVFLEGLMLSEVARRDRQSCSTVMRRYRRALEWLRRTPFNLGR